MKRLIVIAVATLGIIMSCAPVSARLTIVDETIGALAATAALNEYSGAAVPDAPGQDSPPDDGALISTVEFSQSVYVEDESQIAVLTVGSFGDLSGAATISYTTQVSGLGSNAVGGASCAPGVDYIQKSGALTFNAEEEFREVQIQLCGDVLSETGEFFNVRLANPLNSALGSLTTARVEINDTANQFVNQDSIFVGTSGDSYASTITVSGAPTAIGSMRVTLYDFEHIDAEDVDVLLVGPQGQKILLMGDAGGADGLAERRTITFDDQAGQILPDSTAILSGRYEPTTWQAGQSSFPAPAPPAPYSEPGSAIGGAVSLASVFGGSNANGTWTLYLRDDNGAFLQLGADGVVNGGWGIQFLAPTAAGVSVSGRVRGAGRPVAGAIVTITGGDLTAPRMVRTNGFGNYTFAGLTSGQIYVVSVAAKRYIFSSPIVLSVEDNIVGADFEADER